MLARRFSSLNAFVFAPCALSCTASRTRTRRDSTGRTPSSPSANDSPFAFATYFRYPQPSGIARWNSNVFDSWGARENG